MQISSDQNISNGTGTRAKLKFDLKSLEALNLTFDSEKTNVLALTANLQWSERWQWSTPMQEKIDSKSRAGPNCHESPLNPFAKKQTQMFKSAHGREELA